MTAPLTAEPDVLRAGDTVVLQVEAADYPASAGWQMTLYLRGASTLDVTATGAGSTYTFTLASSSTANLLPGLYRWRRRVSKAAEVYTVAEGTLTVAPNLATAGAGAALSWEERTLAVIEAFLEGHAVDAVASYTIGGQQVTRIPLPELLTLRTRLRAAVAAQRRGGKLAAVRMTFTAPAST